MTPAAAVAAAGSVSTAAAGPKPLAIFDPAQAATGLAPWEPAWWFWALIAGALLVVIVVSLWAWWRRRTSPEERGFVIMALRLGLSRRERRLVRTLTPAGAHPVAALLCEGLFTRLVAAAPAHAGPLARVRRKIYG